MLITLIALAIALTIEFFFPAAVNFNFPFLAPLIAAMGGIILLGALYLYTTILAPLAKLEQKLVPNLMQLLHRHWGIYLERFFLFLFPLLSCLAALFLSQQDLPYQGNIFLVWFILLAFSLDLLRNGWKRLVNFLNPVHVVDQLLHEAKRAVKADDDQHLWQTMDAISEIALRAVEKSKIALSNQALQTFPPIMHAFFSSSKSISRMNQDTQLEQNTGRDEASYTIYYLLQRLELIYDKALHDRLETVCRQMILILGKTIVYAAQLDLSLVSFPTHFLSKFGLKAQQHRFNEVASLTISTLVEISRAIVTEIDITYAELLEPYQAILNGLDALAKGTFQQDKNSSIKVLVQPLVDIKNQFQTEKMAHHRDTPAILREIDRLMDEFTVLEQVMRSIPSVQDLAGSPPAPTL